MFFNLKCNGLMFMLFDSSKHILQNTHRIFISGKFKEILISNIIKTDSSFNREDFDDLLNEVCRN